MAKSTPAAPGAKERVLGAIKSPLSVVGLIVLLIEGILGGLAARAGGSDFTALVYGMLLSLFGLIGLFFYTVIFRPNALVVTEARSAAPEPAAPTPQHYDYDVFLSAPMAAARSDKEYVAFRAEAMAIANHLRTHCGFERVYYAGENIATRGDFDSEGLAIRDDYKRLTASHYFLLVFLHPVVSSTLVEAGIALQLGIPSAYLVKNSDDLPFLLRNATEAFPHVHIHECENLERARVICGRSRERIFTG